jgi:GNAT superfamily N-acetyltransferase
MVTLDEARARWSGHTGRVWLAQRAGVLLGFAAATGVELDGLYVLPRESGAGISSALLEAISEVRRLWVLEDNYAARHWYEGRGWHNSGERQRAYGVWDVLYVR